MLGLPQDWPKVAIVILNWNGWQDTLECLESIEKIAYPNYEVILVDNGSVDDSVPRITEWLTERSAHWGTAVELPEPVAPGLPSGARVVLQTSRLTLIRSEENLGFAGGCNLAVDYALARDPSIEFVFFLNNDAHLCPYSVLELIHAARTHSIDLLGAVIMDRPGGQIIFSGSDCVLEFFCPTYSRRLFIKQVMKGNNFLYTCMVPGSAMLVTRKLLEDRIALVGYVFDPHLFLYAEELELCLWARQRGYIAAIVANSIVYHPRKDDDVTKTIRMNYYLSRNLLLVGMLYFAGFKKLLFLPLYVCFRMVLALRWLLRGRWLFAKAIVHGLRDGFRDLNTMSGKCYSRVN